MKQTIVIKQGGPQDPFRPGKTWEDRLPAKDRPRVQAAAARRKAQKA